MALGENCSIEATLFVLNRERRKLPQGSVRLPTGLIFPRY